MQSETVHPQHLPHCDNSGLCSSPPRHAIAFFKILFSPKVLEPAGSQATRSKQVTTPGRVTERPAFANTLRRLRHNAGLTQEDVADILDVSRAAIAQWETGRGTPLTRRLPDLAAVLNTSIQKLFEE